MQDTSIMSGAEVVAQLKEEQEWAEKVKEMDALCQTHLNASYEDCAVQGHYIFVKLAPRSGTDFPLKTKSGFHLSQAAKIRTVHCGLVVAIGRYAFKDGPATKWTHGPLCNLGDYIFFSTPEHTTTLFNGFEVGAIRDTSVMFTTKKPHLFSDYTMGRSFAPPHAKKIIFKRKDIEEEGFVCTDPTVLFREDFEEDAK